MTYLNNNNNDRYHVWYLNGKRRVVDLHMLKHFYTTVSKENPYHDGDKAYNTYPYHAEAHLVDLTDEEIKKANSFYDREESEVEATGDRITDFGICPGSLNYLILRAQRGSIKAQNQIINFFIPLLEEDAPLPKRLKGNKVDDYWTDEFVHESVNYLIRLIHQHDFSGHFKPRVMANIRDRKKDTLRNERKKPDSSINPTTLFLDKERENSDGSKYNLHDEFFVENIIVDFDSTIDLNILLKDLSERDKEILKLYYIKGYTQEEIGGLLSISKMAISKKLSKLLKLLQKAK